MTSPRRQMCSGYVTVRLSLHPDQAGSSRKVADWFVELLRCDELAVGEVRFDEDSTYVSLHSSSFNRHESRRKA